MKRIHRIAATVTVFLIFAGGAACTRLSPEDRLEGFSRPALAAFVDAACLEVARRGEAAFDDFRKRDGKWFQGDKYIFVIGPDAMRYVYPPDPQGENQNLASLRDVQGKAIIQLHLAAVNNPQGAGWSYFEWPRPGQIFPSLKCMYVKKVTSPSGKDYIVGSGVYMTQPDMPLVRQIVDQAASLLGEQGRNTFPLFRDSAGPFVFGDLYVFVYSLEGICLFNYAWPELEGKSMIDFVDADGTKPIRNMIDGTRDTPNTILRGLWPHPGYTQPRHKIGYIRRVETPDGVMLVGSGMYLD